MHSIITNDELRIMVAQGMTRHQIASAVGLAVQTINNRLTMIGLRSGRRKPLADIPARQQVAQALPANNWFPV